MAAPGRNILAVVDRDQHLHPMAVEGGEGLVQLDAAGLIEAVIGILDDEVPGAVENFAEEDQLAALSGTELPVALAERIGHRQGRQQRRSVAAGRQKGDRRRPGVRVVEKIAVVDQEFVLVDVLLDAEGDDSSVLRQNQDLCRRDDITGENGEQVIYPRTIVPIDAPGLVRGGQEIGNLQRWMTEVFDLHEKKSAGVHCDRRTPWRRSGRIGIGARHGEDSTAG